MPETAMGHQQLCAWLAPSVQIQVPADKRGLNAPQISADQAMK
jgi:hypothetical protein